MYVHFVSRRTIFIFLLKKSIKYKKSWKRKGWKEFEEIGRWQVCIHLAFLEMVQLNA